MNENYFMFNHIRYRAEEVKENDRSKCSRCAFREHRECDYWSDIPECSKACRKDGRSVVFVEAKRNFEKITASPEALAGALVRLWVMGSRSFPSFVWLGIKDNENYEAFNKRTVAISATLEWLGKEAEK